MRTFISLLIFISVGVNSTIFAQSKIDDRAEKARQTANKIGSGYDAKVEVKLRDKTTLKDHIISVASESFSIMDSNGSPRTILFSDVEKLKKRGGGLGIGAWIGIGAAAAGATVLIAILSIRCRNEGGC